MRLMRSASPWRCTPLKLLGVFFFGLMYVMLRTVPTPLDLSIDLDSFNEEVDEAFHPPLPEGSRGTSLGIVGDWRESLGVKGALYLYSAYVDRRKAGQPVMRLVTIAKRRTKFVECIFWTENRTFIRRMGKFETMKENWNLEYSGAYVVCPLPEMSTSNPLARVSVTTDASDMGTFEDGLLYMDLHGRARIGELSVCVKPFHYEFNRALWLVEFVEMYRELGADKFIFYNHTVGPDVQKVLEYYMREGVVELHPWALPVKSQAEIRTEGIFPSLNDCALRSVSHYPLTAMVDVDEFIIPRQHDNLISLVQEIGEGFDTYVFKNVFFYLYWENDTSIEHTSLDLGSNLFRDAEGIVRYPYLLTQAKTRRLSAPHKHGTRSKYITRPERIIQAGNHLVWEAIGQKRSKNVPESLALSHHYRICEFGGFDCLKDPNEIDTTAHQFMVPLAHRVSKACSAIFSGQPACPVAPPLGSPW